MMRLRRLENAAAVEAETAAAHRAELGMLCGPLLARGGLPRLREKPSEHHRLHPLRGLFVVSYAYPSAISRLSVFTCLLASVYYCMGKRAR